MPGQRFCSVPGCLSTTEVIKREQAAFLAAFCSSCLHRRPCRCPAPDIYTTRRETRAKFTSWCVALGLRDPGYYINVCYKHFSAGAPTKDCPVPDVIRPPWEDRLKKPRSQQTQKPYLNIKTLLSSLEQPGPSIQLDLCKLQPLPLEKLMSTQQRDAPHVKLFSSLPQPASSVALSEDSEDACSLLSPSEDADELESEFRLSRSSTAFASEDSTALLDESADPYWNQGHADGEEEFGWDRATRGGGGSEMVDKTWSIFSTS